MACKAPPTSRAAISTHKAVASPVAKKLSPKPKKPSSSTGRRPYRSDKAPSTGDARKFVNPNENITTPYHNAWSACESVKLPTSAGNTGMIKPMAIMSISTVSMMKGMAASRDFADSGMRLSRSEAM